MGGSDFTSAHCRWGGIRPPTSIWMVDRFVGLEVYKTLHGLPFCIQVALQAAGKGMNAGHRAGKNL